MHTGLTGLIRKTRIGRGVLFHLNTGVFWIYGVLTFLLSFSVSGFWLQNTAIRVLLSLPPALVAAFTFWQMIHVIFWRRFRNPRMDTFVMLAFVLAIFLVGYGRDVQGGRGDALRSLFKNFAIFVLIGLISYVSRRKKAA
jgi:hypothetical protein